MENYKKNLIYLPLQKKYRSNIEIIALILEAAKGSSVASCPIMKHANINYAQLKKFLPSLIKIGFMEMEVRKGRILFRISEKGLAFLRQYNILRDMLLSAYVSSKMNNAIQGEKSLPKVEQHVRIPF